MRTSVIVMPTEQTLRRMQSIVESTVLSPLSGALMNIEIAGTDAVQDVAWTPDPSRVYADVHVRTLKSAARLSLKGTTSRLMAYVESPTLSLRCRELTGNLEPLFVWTLMYDVPPGRNVMRAIAHLTDTLVYREPAFSFTGEMLLKV